METVVNKIIVLKLNAGWQPIDYCSIKRAIIDLAAGLSAKALAFEYNLNCDGEPEGKPISIIPTEWDDWIKLPVRPWEFGVSYHNGDRFLRAPSVIVAKNYSEMPLKLFKGNPSKEGILIRDNFKCQYTGKKLKRENVSIDHVIPKSKGGKDVWENLVATSKEINFKKGNLTNKEAGLKLIRKPGPPIPIPKSLLIRRALHLDWKPFLIENDD
jgi:hypothetical protein